MKEHSRAPMFSALVVSAFLFTTFVPGGLSAVPAEQEVLLEIKQSLGNPSSLQSWTMDQDCSKWSGVSCDSEGIVTSLRLNYYGLSGSIPSSIGDLLYLQQLSLYSNQFTGSIPSSLGNLEDLKELDLRYNQLSGAIPSSLMELSKLQNLYLDSNRLSGSIPSSLGNLKNLYYLSLQSNQLTGSIPSSLGSLRNLYYLFLHSNQLSGAIPTSLGNLVYLYYLYLGSNQLSGTLPSSLGNLTNLYYMDLSSNQLAGDIPTSFGNLKRLYALSLQANRLSGPIPSSFGTFSNLQQLYLQSNQLSGPIPSSLGNLANLQQLNLQFNQLSGSIPSTLGSLSKLNDLFLQSNQLSGSLPSSLGNLANLKQLFVSNNSLTGTIPCTLRSLNSLQKSSFHSNRFVGYYPFLHLKGSLANISNNYFIGAVPSKFVAYKTFFSSNCLTGMPNQRGSSECSRFCGATSTSLPCNGNGACYFESQSFDSIAACSSTLSEPCAATGPTSPPIVEPEVPSLPPKPWVFPPVSGDPPTLPPPLSPVPTPAPETVSPPPPPPPVPTPEIVSPPFVTDPPPPLAPSPTPPPSSSLCYRSMFNPCGMGSCFELNGKISCVCPNGYGKSQRSDGRSACILKKANRSVKPMCNVWYTIVQTDTCESISKLFGLQNVTSLLNLNPKLSCSNRVPFQSICVSQNRQYERNFVCKTYKSVGKAKSCLELASPGVKLLKLFESNPGMYCNNVQANPKRYCTSTLLLSELGCKKSFTVKTKDTCDYLIVRYFNGKAKRFSSANKGLVCNDEFLYDGLQLCLP